jgi:hypothetical protein
MYVCVCADLCVGISGLYVCVCWCDVRCVLDDVQRSYGNSIGWGKI